MEKHGACDFNERGVFASPSARKEGRRVGAREKGRREGHHPICGKKASGERAGGRGRDCSSHLSKGEDLLAPPEGKRKGGIVCRQKGRGADQKTDVGGADSRKGESRRPLLVEGRRKIQGPSGPPSAEIGSRRFLSRKGRRKRNQQH